MAPPDYSKKGTRQLLNLAALIFISALLSGCATNTLMKYEDGDIIEGHRNTKTTIQPDKYDAAFSTSSQDVGPPSLEIKITKSAQSLEEWEDVYSKVGVYATRCRGWRNGKSGIFENGYTPPYCAMDIASFIVDHIFVFGFLYDLAIPFLPYEDAVVETRAIVSEPIIKADSKTLSEVKPVDSTQIKLTINGVVATSKLSDGVASFRFSDFHLTPDPLPDKATTSVDLNGKHLDVSSQFLDFVTGSNETHAKLREAREKERIEKQFSDYTAACYSGKLNSCKLALVYIDKEKITDQDTEVQKIYEKLCPRNYSYCAKSRQIAEQHMSRCSQQLLGIYFPAGYGGKDVESGCTYTVDGRFQVIQVVSGGILVGLIPQAQSFQAMPDPTKVLFVSTGRQFVDGQALNGLSIYSTGVMSYTTVLGAKKTVQSFQATGE